jgi:hypothetical protein
MGVTHPYLSQSSAHRTAGHVCRRLMPKAARGKCAKPPAGTALAPYVGSHPDTSRTERVWEYVTITGTNVNTIVTCQTRSQREPVTFSKRGGDFMDSWLRFDVLLGGNFLERLIVRNMRGRSSFLSRSKGLIPCEMGKRLRMNQIGGTNCN